MTEINISGNVPVAGMISTTHESDTFATHDTNLGWGTPKIVRTVADFAKVTDERLRIGTLGVVTADWDPINNGIYLYTASGWKKFQGGGSGGDGYTDTTFLSELIKVTGVTVGGLSDGDEITQNTDLTTILKRILQKQIAPTYKLPTIQISGSNIANLEMGEIISPVITSTYTQNDAGIANRHTITSGSNIVYDGDFINTYTLPNIEVTQSTYQVRSTLYYNEGPIKEDNFGTPYPEGHIQAGSIQSNILNYIGYRKAFYEVFENPTPSPTTSDQVRALGNFIINPTKGKVTNVAIPIGTRTIIFGYPAILGSITDIKSQALNISVLSSFTNNTVMVSGANNYNPTQYNIYTSTSDLPFSSTDTYIVTI